MWKSRPNGKLNILKALTGNGMIEPSSDWYQSFVSLMDEKVANATAQASAAAQSAQQAQQAVADVDNKISAAASESRARSRVIWTQTMLRKQI